MNVSICDFSQSVVEISNVRLRRTWVISTIYPGNLKIVMKSLSLTLWLKYRVLRLDNT